MKQRVDGDGSRGGESSLPPAGSGASAVLGGSSPSNTATPPAESTSPVTTLTEAMDTSLAGLTAIASCDAARLGSAEASVLIDGLDRVRALADTATLGLLVELIDRGEAPGAGHGLVDWLGMRCPAMPRSHAVDLVRIATACASERGLDRTAHAPVLAAVSDGRVSVRRGSMVMRALGKVRPVLDDDTYAADVALVLDAAERRETFTERDLVRITDKLVASAMSTRDHEHRDAGAHATRGVAESSLADGSVTRFIIDADPHGAATFRAVMTSTLAAPSPGPEGTPDRRSAAARRYDALITILTRGMATPEGQPTTASAQIIVTVDFDTLATQLDKSHATDASGDTNPFGHGFTATGDLLSPATIRRLACDADIIPAVLGTNNELLDLGRTHRLITPGQRRALAHRDQHCTYPGCSIPATWCDAHHITHWAHGGQSNLANYALLCQKHHTHVHQHNLTATLDASAPPGTAIRWRQHE